MIYSITLLYDRHQQAGMLKVSENAFVVSWSFPKNYGQFRGWRILNFKKKTKQ